VPKKLVSENNKYRTTDQWLNKSARHPKEEKWISPNEENAGYKVWRTKLAKERRQHIREGVQELFNRDVHETKRDLKRQKEQQETLAKARNAPERVEDEYARESVSEAVKYILESKVQTLPEPEEEFQARAEIYDAINQAKKEERMDQLHELYMKARNFIVTEEQLSEEIEKVFGADDNPVVWPGNSLSVWGQRRPPSTTELAGVLPEDVGSERRVKALKRRMYRIAGELTGGEIDLPEHLKKDTKGLDL
jgi:hypothetical protein